MQHPCIPLSRVFKFLQIMATLSELKPLHAKVRLNLIKYKPNMSNCGAKKHTLLCTGLREHTSNRKFAMYLTYIKLAIVCEYIAQLVRHTHALYLLLKCYAKNMQGFDYIIAKCKNVYAVVKSTS